MKLKKIAALAMSGVMAVSMLAGCKSGNGGQVPPEENNGNATGYSAMLAEDLKDVMKDIDYVTFQDNNKDADALADALGNLGSVTTGGSTVLTRLVSLDGPNKCLNYALGLDEMIKDFVENSGITNGEEKLHESDELNFAGAQNYNINQVAKRGNIYAIDGTIDIEKAMEQVADQLTSLNKAPKSGSADGISWDFHYTVSVSVVNKPLTVIDGYNGTANFIAVTVTRTPVK